MVFGLLTLLISRPDNVAHASPEANGCWGLPCEIAHRLDTSGSDFANEHNWVDIDSNQDGVLDDMAEVYSGDIFFRNADGVTQVEENHYIIPNNRVYVDLNADDILDVEEEVLARIVVVTQDNLTYVFHPNSHRVQAIFPNGTGRAGANTITSVRRINVELGAEWGQAESERENLIRYPDGTMPNYFGDRTLGTRFFIQADASFDIDTQQELHGTFVAHAGSVDGVSLLGTEISGGCTRHSNFAARYMASVVAIGDAVITIETPEDDSVDNPLTIYNRTRLAASLDQVSLSDYLISSVAPLLLSRPSNEVVSRQELTAVSTPTWRNFSEIGYPTSFTPVEHPFYRGAYTLIPCGSETLWITSQTTDHQVLRLESGYFSLILPAFITLPDGTHISPSTFYQPTRVTLSEIQSQLTKLSAGDPMVGVFEYLFSDFAYQYANYLVTQQQGVELSYEEMTTAIAHLPDQQLREIQLVTGVIPVRYFTTTPGPDGVIGDRLGIITNRTMIQHAMNVLYGESAPTYELDPRQPYTSNAFLLRDMQISSPAMDNEVVRVGEVGVSVESLLRDGLTNRRPIVLRISYYRHLADLSYIAGLPAGHYFAVIPEYSDLEEGYIGVYDTMHPYQIMQVPLDQVDDLFTTITIGG